LVEDVAPTVSPGIGVVLIHRARGCKRVVGPLMSIDVVEGGSMRSNHA
jgi:hypothetical protein